MGNRGNALMVAVVASAVFSILLAQGVKTASTFNKVRARGRSQSSFNAFRRDLELRLADSALCQSSLQGLQFSGAPGTLAQQKITGVRILATQGISGDYFAEAGKVLDSGLKVESLELLSFQTVSGIPSQFDAFLNFRVSDGDGKHQFRSVLPVRLGVTGMGSNKTISSCAPPVSDTAPSVLTLIDLSTPPDTFVVEDATYKNHDVNTDGATCGFSSVTISGGQYALCSLTEVFHQNSSGYRICSVYPSGNDWLLYLSGCSHDRVRCRAICAKRVP